MSDPRSPRFRMTRAIKQIASPFAISTETLIASSIPIIVANLVLDYGREPGTFATWLLIAVLGYLAMLVIPVLVRLFFGSKPLFPVVYLLIFLASGVLRGATIYLVGVEAGVIKEIEWQYRILGSPLFVFLTLSLVTVLVSNSLRATEELEGLEASRAQLEQRLNTMRTEIARLNSELAGRVSGLITPVIQQLMEGLRGAKASDIGTEVDALRATVDDVVRPLSIDIAQAKDEFSNQEVAKQKVSIRENLFASNPVLISNQILPFWSSIMIAIVSLPAALVFYLSDAFAALGLFALSTLLVLELSSFLFRNVWLKTGAALLVQIVIFAVAGLAASVSLRFAQLEAGAYPSGRIVTLTIIVGVAVFIGQLRQTQRMIAQQKAREVNAQLELLNSQARRELWLNRRRIATVLHGPVQAALYASAMKLAQAKRPSKKLINSVNKDLESALEVLKFDSAESVDLRDVLSQIVEVWAGTCDIYITLSKNVYLAARKSSVLNEAVAEVLREAISNAIKHGQATEIEVEAKISEKLIELSIVNNGKAPVNKAGKGFGSKLYDELTLDWNLSEMADGRTKFGATIFIA